MDRIFRRWQAEEDRRDGGAPVRCADAPNRRGGAWGEDDTIVFSPEPDRGTRLLRVLGRRERRTADVARRRRGHPALAAGPAGRQGGALYGQRHPGAYDDANIVVQPLPDGHESRPAGGRRYLTGSVTCASGHLVYIHDGTLFAAPFDLDRLEVTGRAGARARRRDVERRHGGAQFAVSANGTLVYLPGQSAGAGIPIHWMDREGQTTPLRVSPRTGSIPLLARWPAARHGDPRRITDIWVYEWRGTRSRA